MIWRMFLPNRPTQAIVTQVAGADGKAGSLTASGVVTYTTTATHLCGLNAQGHTVLVVPLAEVAVAVVNEVKND